MLQTKLPTISLSVVRAREAGKRFSTPAELYRAWGRPHFVSDWNDAGDQESWDYRATDGSISFIIRPSSNYCRVYQLRLLCRILEPHIRKGLPLKGIEEFLAQHSNEARDALGRYYSNSEYNWHLTGADGNFNLVVKNGIIRQSTLSPPSHRTPLQKILYQKAVEGTSRFRP